MFVSSSIAALVAAGTVLAATPPGFEPASSKDLGVYFCDNIATDGAELQQDELEMAPVLGTAEHLSGEFAVVMVDTTPSSAGCRAGNTLQYLQTGLTSSKTVSRVAFQDMMELEYSDNNDALAPFIQPFSQTTQQYVTLLLNTTGCGMGLSAFQTAADRRENFDVAEVVRLSGASVVAASFFSSKGLDSATVKGTRKKAQNPFQKRNAAITVLNHESAASVIPSLTQPLLNQLQPLQPLQPQNPALTTPPPGGQLQGPTPQPAQPLQTLTPLPGGAISQPQPQPQNPPVQRLPVQQQPPVFQQPSPTPARGPAPAPIQQNPGQPQASGSLPPIIQRPGQSPVPQPNQQLPGQQIPGQQNPRPTAPVQQHPGAPVQQQPNVPGQQPQQPNRGGGTLPPIILIGVPTNPPGGIARPTGLIRTPITSFATPFVPGQTGTPSSGGGGVVPGAGGGNLPPILRPVNGGQNGALPSNGIVQPGNGVLPPNNNGVVTPTAPVPGQQTQPNGLPLVTNAAVGLRVGGAGEGEGYAWVGLSALVAALLF